MKRIIQDKQVLFYTILLFAFIAPLSRAANSLFIVLLPIIWIIEGNLHYKWTVIKENKILVALSLYILWGIITILWSINIESSINGVRLSLYFMVVFIIATSVKKSQVMSVITAFIMGVFVSEIIAYGVFFELWTTKHSSVSNPSPFMIHIAYSTFLAFTATMLLSRIFSMKYTIKEKSVFSLFFLTVTGNLFLTAGRTGQIELFFAVFVLSFIHLKFNVKSLLISSVLIVTIFFSAYNLSDTFVKRVNDSKVDIEKIFDGNLNGSWGVRVAYWKVSYDTFLEHPFGSGLGTDKIALSNTLSKNDYTFINETKKSFMMKHHPHNQYLLVLIQMGFIGLLLFLNLLYQVIKYKEKNRELKEIGLIFSTIFVIAFFTDSALVNQFTLILFVLMLGLIATSESEHNAS